MGGLLHARHHGEFPPERLVDAKVGGGHHVSVCLPARDEESTIGHIVEVLRNELVDHWPLVDEVLVLDDGSVDATARVAAGAGATVVAGADVLEECGPGVGKGNALWKSLHAAKGDLLLFCDADVRGFEPHFVTGLLGPLLCDDTIGFVKGFYRRPVEGRPDGGGRVTELVARPLLALLFPDLAPVVQPLAGEYGGRRQVLEQVPFVEGYGVDLGLLIDIAARFGLSAIAQVDLGCRVHRNRPLSELAPQSTEILRTALGRAGALGDEVRMAERPPIVSVPAYRRRS
jgi:glucosyl-3-phosphoglycerate synthase